MSNRFEGITFVSLTNISLGNVIILTSFAILTASHKVFKLPSRMPLLIFFCFRMIEKLFDFFVHDFNCLSSTVGDRLVGFDLVLSIEFVFKMFHKFLFEGV